MGERERESEREREEQVLEQTYSGKKGLWNIPRSSAATTVAKKGVFLHRPAAAAASILLHDASPLFEFCALRKRKEGSEGGREMSVPSDRSPLFGVDPRGVFRLFYSLSSYFLSLLSLQASSS